MNARIKEWLDANFHDGEDRSGSFDKSIFSPDELQELCEDLVDFLLTDKETRVLENEDE